MANEKDWGKITFLVNLGVALLVVVLSLTLFIKFINKDRKELLIFSYEMAWKNFGVVFDKYIEYVPHRMMNKLYWKGRQYYDEQCKETFGIKTVESWEKQNISNTVGLGMINKIRVALKPVFPTESYMITSVYGYRSNPLWSRIGGQLEGLHKGLDIGIIKNDKIYAVADGVVIVNKRNYSYGNYIRIRHDLGFVSLYGHLSKSLVTNKQVVKKGDVIGIGGTTGRSTGYHLHLETLISNEAFNPLLFL